MKKKVIIIGLVVWVGALLYAVCGFAMQQYAAQCGKEGTSFRFLGHTYTAYAQPAYDGFEPFGAYNCFYRDQVKFLRFLGFEMQKGDRNRWFIYDHSALGATVYKRTDYEVPLLPESDDIDKILLWDAEQDPDAAEMKTLTDRAEITSIVKYFNGVYHKYAANETDQIQICAISSPYGGLFFLNGGGRSVSVNAEGQLCHDTLRGEQAIPKAVQAILQKALNK